MPVQRFAAMTKDFATFDCDAHVTEPPLIWERAAEYLTREEMQALRSTIWWDEESRQRNCSPPIGVQPVRMTGSPASAARSAARAVSRYRRPVAMTLAAAA